MYSQQFTLKHIKLLTKSFRPNQFYHRAGLISLYCSEFVSNKHLIVSSAGTYIGPAESGGEGPPRKNFVLLEKCAGQS